MRWLYLGSVWLHVLAATVWIGGLLFVSLVFVPMLRKMDRSEAAALMQKAGKRFRAIGWVCFGVLIATGIVNLGFRGVRWNTALDATFLQSSFGELIVWKLGLFGCVIGISAWHDFVVGPRATLVLRQAPHGEAAARVRRKASLAGRLNGVLAVVILSLAVGLVRGC